MSASIMFLLSLAITSPSTDDLLLKIGDQAPPFAMRDLQQKVFSIRNHSDSTSSKPRKALLLIFFATWCKPCKKEIPVIKQIHKHWATPKRGIEIVYIGLSQGRKELTPFVKQEKLPWRVIPDGFGLLARRYGASQLPHLFVVDNKGKIAFQHRGVAPDLYPLLEEQLARVTGEKAPAAVTAPAQIVHPRFHQKYLLGRVPSSTTSAARWQPLGVFVGEAVSANIDVVTENSYADFRKALQQGKFDLANAGPLLCYTVKQQYEPIARIERQGSSTYFGIIFSKRHSHIRSLMDLKGKTLGLVAEYSSSGSVYQQLALRDTGLIPGRDVKLKFLGSHPAVAHAVAKGDVDAGGCYEDCRDAVWTNDKDKAQATRILSYTNEIPSEMIIIKRSLKPELKDKFANALLKLNETPGILAQISQGETTVTSIIRATDKDLGEIEHVIRRVK